MDPNATLDRIRELVASINKNDGLDEDDFQSMASELAEYVEALDEWISKGGFLPTAWQRSINVVGGRIPCTNSAFVKVE
jgi:hypothetical protein